MGGGGSKKLGGMDNFPKIFALGGNFSSAAGTFAQLDINNPCNFENFGMLQANFKDFKEKCFSIVFNDHMWIQLCTF